jgi:Lon protease-like protein
MIGTVATMLQLGELGDNRFLVLTVGSRRIRVNAWLPDDPYPLADVDELPDVWPSEWLAGGQDAVEAQLSALQLRLGPITGRVRRLAALALELGDPGTDTSTTISDDPLLASYQLMTMAPIGSADSYRLLAAPGPFERIGMLEAMLDDLEAMLQFRLADDGYDLNDLNDLDDLDDMDGPDHPDDPDQG